jgi:hypothetical protein
MRRISIAILTVALSGFALPASAAPAPYKDHCDRETKISECFDIMLMNAETG